MAGYCATYLFYSYIAATIVYLILGIFANTGNLALLIEHYQLDGDTQELKKDEPSDVKSRTLGQYYFASALSFSLVIVIFFMYIKEKPKNKNYFNQTISLDLQEHDILNQHDNDNIKPIELAQPEPEIEPESSNIKAINTLNDDFGGMVENDI